MGLERGVVEGGNTVFKHWPEIENSYHRRFVTDFVNQYPELKDETFVITEKIHGSNMQWFFRTNKDMLAGSRNNFLSLTGSFQGVQITDLVDAHRDLLVSVQKLTDRTYITVRLFGELFGRGVQKGVEYGPERRILYFGMMINDILISFAELERIIPAAYLVPVVGKVVGLEAALEFDTRFDSLILGTPNNICEGVVIQPYTKVYLDVHGNPFILKKKNPEFAEKKQAQRQPHTTEDPEVERLKAELLSYITENRLESVFSKHGRITSPNQIGDYIRLLLADAKEDFLKDFGPDFAALNKEQQKNVCKVGGNIMNLLKNYL